MHLYTDVASLQAHLAELRQQGQSIGFVPTMGALHEGHLSLVTHSRKENDFTVCSVYVNPTQFNDPGDLEKYPRNVERDQEMLAQAGCDALFLPSDSIMYPGKTVVSISFGYLESILEGEHRPGHFQGVGLVVSKLLHLVQPNRAYFGEKDLQQVAIIRQLVQDLMFPVEIVGVPIVREPDGLAMSSRNGRLDTEDRQRATLLYRCLTEARSRLLQGQALDEVKAWVSDTFAETDGVRLEYFEAVHPHSLSVYEELSEGQPTSLCIAAWVGEVRLIDNLSV